ncbi:hypothetical protein [Teichococcus deserti]|nr:hypothetical protein [Pseudoroseomonas deserti]
MSFLSSLKLADVTPATLRKDPVGIAIEAFLQKVEVQLAYAEADKAGTTYNPPRARKEPAKREPLDMRWYRRNESVFVTVIKVGRQPITKDEQPLVYEIGSTLDDVIGFFTGLKKAATDRDPELVKEVLAAKAAQAKAQPAPAGDAAPESLAAPKAANPRKR